MTVDENLIRHMILNSIRMYRAKFHRTYGEVVICVDGLKNWRKEVFPQYKHKRRKARKESSIDWNEVYRIINLVLEELKHNFPYSVVQVDEVEADDIIGTLCEMTQEFGKGEPVVIVSKDKDFVQLQKFRNVSQFSPQNKALVVEPNPRKAKLELILKGDQGDGVPNVLSPDNSFTDDIRQKPLRQTAIDQLIEDQHALGEEVYRNFLRNKKLIDLDETPTHLKEKIIYTYENQDNTGNRNKVYPFLVTKGCVRLLEDIQDFI